jgi:hypothetical protein
MELLGPLHSDLNLRAIGSGLPMHRIDPSLHAFAWASFTTSLRSRRPRNLTGLLLLESICTLSREPGQYVVSGPNIWLWASRSRRLPFSLSSVLGGTETWNRRRRRNNGEKSLVVCGNRPCPFAYLAGFLSPMSASSFSAISAPIRSTEYYFPVVSGVLAGSDDRRAEMMCEERVEELALGDGGGCSLLFPGTHQPPWRRLTRRT